MLDSTLADAYNTHISKRNLKGLEMKSKELLQRSKPVFQSLMLTQLGISFKDSDLELTHNLAPNLVLCTQEDYVISRRVLKHIHLDRTDRKTVYSLLLKALNEVSWEIEDNTTEVV
jgi:hypothetical protein